MFCNKNKINKLLLELILLDKNDLNGIRLIYLNIVRRIFYEECFVYIDKISKSKTLIEVHFDDYNFYEIELEDMDNIETVIFKTINNLINERYTDKENISINRNNVRYFKKV